MGGALSSSEVNFTDLYGKKKLMMSVPALHLHQLASLSSSSFVFFDWSSHIPAYWKRYNTKLFKAALGTWGSNPGVCETGIRETTVWILHKVKGRQHSAAIKSLKYWQPLTPLSGHLVIFPPENDVAPVLCAMCVGGCVPVPCRDPRSRRGGWRWCLLVARDPSRHMEESWRESRPGGWRWGEEEEGGSV